MGRDALEVRVLGRNEQADRSAYDPGAGEPEYGGSGCRPALDDRRISPSQVVGVWGPARHTALVFSGSAALSDQAIGLTATVASTSGGADGRGLVGEEANGDTQRSFLRSENVPYMSPLVNSIALSNPIYSAAIGRGTSILQQLGLFGF